MHLLLIEDDRELCRLMEAYFAAQDVRVTSVHDGPGGLASALTAPYDLLLLDVMLPGFDGFSLLQQLRAASNIPVILLTARTAHADRIRGLEQGADDYLPKPLRRTNCWRAFGRFCGAPDRAAESPCSNRTVYGCAHRPAGRGPTTVTSN
jgi:DNA-binding response OmpR family regulator